jgi:hypothetical protein
MNRWTVESDSDSGEERTKEVTSSKEGTLEALAVDVRVVVA